MPSCLFWAKLSNILDILSNTIQLLALEAMALLSVRRQVADPNIGIKELMQVFQIYVVQCNNYDFMELVSGPRQYTWSWKTSPNPTWMFQIHRLVNSLLGVAANGVLPAAKVKQALMKLSESMKINQTKSSTADFADKVDQRIRIVMAQYRQVKTNPYEYQRLMKKATPEEKAAIDKVLNNMFVEAPATKSPAVASSSELAMVPFGASASKEAGPQEVVVAPSSSSSSTSSKTGIFSRILAKQDSSPSSQKKVQHFGVLAAKAAPSEPAARAASPAKLQRKNAFFQDSGGFCVPGDDTASELSMPSPMKKQPKRKQSSSQADLSSNSKEKKGKAATVCKGDLSDDDLELVENALELPIGVSKAGNKTKKKPAAAKAVAKKKPEKKKSKQSEAGEKGKKDSKKGSPTKKGNKDKGGYTASSKKQNKSTKATKSCQKKGKKKTTFRHRATSAAYHTAKKRALKQGQSIECAKAAGRTASRKAAEDIDSGLLKDPEENSDKEC